MSIHSMIHALPKAELHVHLLGAIRPVTLLEIMMEEEIEAPFKTPEDISRYFEFTDFPNFIEKYKQIVGYIKREAYFERLAYEMLEDCRESNVCYVEVSFSPTDHVNHGLNYWDMIDAINRGIRRAERAFTITANIRIDLVRNYGPENGMLVLDWIEQKPDNIVSIDIGGSEYKFPAAPFADVYARAEKMGLHRVAHAGEAEGPESIWDAVNHLGVERIGHGVTAREDSELMRALQETNIVIEACPMSNVRTRVVESIADHPIRKFFDYGLLVTVSSDDPSFFHTNMNNEYMQLHEHHGFSLEELFRLSLTAIDVSFLPDKKKGQMRASFVKQYEQIMV